MNACFHIRFITSNFRITTPALIVIFALIFNSNLLKSQTEVPEVPSSTHYILRAEIVNKDTIPVVDLYPIEISTNFIYKNKRQYEQWTRIKSNVKVVYPYAIIAAAKLKEYDRILEKMPNERLRKAYIRICEKDLKNEFEDELKDLSINQGRVLMKLIDRETGKTTYEIVKEMRGGFEACMWQAIARVFGNNMKTEFDPSSEDIMIERAVKLVESGQF